MAKKKKQIDPKIRRMVCANHGGFDDADDNAILSVWNSLDEATKKRYAENLKAGKDKTDADSE